MLRVEDLHVSVAGREIVGGVSFSLEKGKIYAIMGPNGSGKSSLCNALMGNPDYVSKGKIILDGRDIIPISADERARLGMFMSFQNPEEIEGVELEGLMRKAAKPADKKEEIRNWALVKGKVEDAGGRLGLDAGKRDLNVGFSGGEKKKAEIVQMEVLQPKLVLLDEIDSGLDVDALKAVAKAINRMKGGERTFLIVTHYSRMLKYVKPDFVMVMKGGKIVKMDGPALVKRIEKEGYKAV
ncbi:MAG: Fe-S cluster assembly ATPase SufC [Candidatus ainarchaeum sp.]|nr:Fe-S cluster assembly ATPase SufC [Candidatus ainarchaeum sp.]MDD5095939.1 Fe-S cluster assembly ATPase SufC [Candidatus ainarchaeum sp.]